MTHECSITPTLDLLSRKWSLLILHQLDSEPRRFTELLRGIGGINPKSLAQRLAELGRAGLVSRAAFKELPPRVEYSFTPKGRELVRCFRSLDGWAKRWNGKK